MADHNENLKDTLNEEIEHADQKPAEEHYSLNDDRRVKVLSPGMLVAKRFFRNRLAVTGMAILVFMFVFSFIGGLISPMSRISSSTPIRPSAGSLRRSSRIRVPLFFGGRFRVRPACSGAGYAGHPTAEGRLLPTVTTDSP